MSHKTALGILVDVAAALIIFGVILVNYFVQEWRGIHSGLDLVFPSIAVLVFLLFRHLLLRSRLSGWPLLILHVFTPTVFFMLISMAAFYFLKDAKADYMTVLAKNYWRLSGGHTLGILVAGIALFPYGDWGKRDRELEPARPILPNS
jgi:hypothetical protein